jgi:general secretion pathway protein A
MYQTHFGLKKLPFSIAPNPRYLYLTHQHQEALAHLIYGIHGEGGITLLTGEVGTGKTTISRKLPGIN